MCSSGQSLAAKIHPKHLVAFCVVEIKYKVLNVPSLLALMEVGRVFKLLLRCVFDEGSSKNTNGVQGVMSLDGVNTLE